jgi:hypothetical protein
MCGRLRRRGVWVFLVLLRAIRRRLGGHISIMQVQLRISVAGWHYIVLVVASVARHVSLCFAGPNEEAVVLRMVGGVTAQLTASGCGRPVCDASSSMTIWYSECRRRRLQQGDSGAAKVKSALFRAQRLGLIGGSRSHVSECKTILPALGPDMTCGKARGQCAHKAQAATDHLN